MSFDGYFEAVYSSDGILLNENTAPVDMGTYNYNPSTLGEDYIERIFAITGHFLNDMLPYYILENTEEEKQRRVMVDMKWR